MSTAAELIAESCVTRLIVSAAATRAGKTAVVSGTGPAPGESYSYAHFATTVEAAASGLAQRGLQARDVVGILVPDAVSFVLARHAIHTVGGVPSPIDPALRPAEIAGQLAESGARMLITAPPLAETGLAAADRSWVRQVFSFADAPGATLFSDLIGIDMLRPFCGRPDDLALMPFSRGPGGRLRPIPLTHSEAGARFRLAAAKASFADRDVLLATAPVGDGLAYTMLTDAALARGATIVAVAPSDLAAAAVSHHATAALVARADVGAAPDSIRLIPVD